MGNVQYTFKDVMKLHTHSNFELNVIELCDSVTVTSNLHYITSQDCNHYVYSKVAMLLYLMDLQSL